MIWMRLIWELTAGWLNPSRSPALDKLPVSDMATTVRTISIGMFRCRLCNVPPQRARKLPEQPRIGTNIEYNQSRYRLPTSCSASFDGRLKTSAPYSLFEYPHPHHGCFSKALVYRFPAAMIYKAARERRSALADDVSLNDEASTEAALLWSRRNWLARRDIYPCGRHSPRRFRQSSSFLGSVRPDDPRSKQRVSPFKRLQDRFVVVV